MTWARPAYTGLLWLIVLGATVMFFLAGLGLSELGGKSIDPHAALGSFLVIPVVLLLLVAIIGKVGKPYIIAAVALLVVLLLQSVWIHATDEGIVKAIHPLGGLVFFGIAIETAHRITRETKAARSI
jgi:hypothetical protein